MCAYNLAQHNACRPDKSLRESEHLRARTVQLLLADNHEIIRDALRLAFSHNGDAITLIECGNLSDALDQAGKADGLSLAILALRMPGMNGVEGLVTFRGRFPNVPVAVLSGYYCIPEILRIFSLGAIGFISKVSNLESIRNAIRLMLSGQRYVPEEVLTALCDPDVRSCAASEVSTVLGPLQMLTEREGEVLSLLVEGHSNKMIGRSIGVQEVTVKMHIRRIMRKLGVANRTQVVIYALQAGWARGGVSFG